MEFKIPESVKRTMSIMKENGFESYIVGGCVRDFLMGKEPSDFDITTNAKPEETKRCFKGYKVIETGIQHGTVTVLINKEPIEITTYRIDGKYQDNRHPESVEFTVDIAEDLSRRDFTVNALAFDGDRKIVDLFFGREDLKSKIIRCVGNPDKRFNEDGLRILRALRFASVLDFTIEENTAESIRKNKLLLENISRERILTEITKLLCGVNAKKILLDFREVFEVVIPEIKGFSAYKKSIDALDKLPKEKVLRFSAFLSECENSGAVLKALRADNKTVNAVQKLTTDLNTEIKADRIFIKKLLSTREFSELISVAELKCAFGEDKNKCKKIKNMIKDIEKNGECVKLSQLDISGKDLLSGKIAQGKMVGITLEKLLNDVIEGKVENKKEELIKLAKKTVLYEAHS